MLHISQTIHKHSTHYKTIELLNEIGMDAQNNLTQKFYIGRYVLCGKVILNVNQTEPIKKSRKLDFHLEYNYYLKNSQSPHRT